MRLIVSNKKNNHSIPAVSQHKPSLLRRFLPLFIVLGSIAILVVFVSLRQPPPAEEKPPVAQLVDTVSVSQSSLVYTVTSQGTVEPRT